MAETSARLLRLLSLLQARRDWSGGELASRLGVTTRTVRRDVDRLRRIGYPVDAAPGVAGGYRLGHGSGLPPLLLDDDEATAIAIALRVMAASAGAVRGVEESALAALAKVDRMLPPRLRARVDALRKATVRLGGGGGSGSAGGDMVEPDVLVACAQACAGSERVVVRYRDRGDRETTRRLEPYRLVCTGRRWYLAARDVDRDAWRTFRVDRVLDVQLTGHRFELVDAPDAAELVSRSISVSPYRYQVRVTVDAPSHVLARRVPPTVGMIEPVGDDSCMLTTGADHLDAIAAHLVGLDLPFEVESPPELRAKLRSVGEALVARHA